MGISEWSIKPSPVKLYDIKLVKAPVIIPTHHQALFLPICIKLQVTRINVWIKTCLNQFRLSNPVPSIFLDVDLHPRLCCQSPLFITRP